MGLLFGKIHFGKEKETGGRFTGFPRTSQVFGAICGSHQKLLYLQKYPIYHKKILLARCSYTQIVTHVVKMGIEMGPGMGCSNYSSPMIDPIIHYKTSHKSQKMMHNSFAETKTNTLMVKGNIAIAKMH